jgi:LuxR family maltose regulon positive regulatory protein
MSGEHGGGAVGLADAPLCRVATLPASSYTRPARHRDVFDRPDLVERLLHAEGEVTIVAAPAGYGKSTLLALWDHVDARPFAWAHLDPVDDDPTHLLRHIALALDVLDPLDPDVARSLGGPGRSVDDDMLPVLGRWMESRPPFVLVLDDVHYLTSAETCRRVERLIAFLPTGSQMALAGRSVRRFRMARLRLSGAVVSVGPDDLAMSPDDAALLFDNLGISVDGSRVETLVRRTEGWPGGLHLAALAMAQRGEADDAILTGQDRLVGDYLVEEVLSGLPERTVSFLERSAVLDRMSAARLDELLDDDRAAPVLESLDRAGNMFLVPIDRKGEWYRYHHLFREMLRARLQRGDPDTAQRLEARASRLLEQAGDVDGALRHAAEAGETARVADLILRHASQLVFQGEVARLGRRLDLLGQDGIGHLQAAALAWAWYGIAIGDRQLVQRAVLAAERLPGGGPLADGSPSLEVAVAMIKTVTALDGVPGVIRDSELVRTAGGPATNPWWAFATVARGTALSMRGNLDDAQDLFLKALPYIVDAPAIESVTNAHLALIALRRGRRAEADQLATVALRIAERHNLEGVTLMVPVFAVGSLVAARHGRPDQARGAATVTQALLGRLDGLSPRTELLAYLLLAEAATALDHPADARELAEHASRARARDGSANYLNELLDLLHEQLATGTLGRAPAHESLTPAELRVLAFLPTHHSMQDIADQLLVSRNTVKTHLIAIYRKLGVSSRGHAVLAAQRRGLLPG